MAFPARFETLPDYAFPRLRALLSDITPDLAHGEAPTILTIGEPRHPFPEWVPEVLAASAHELGKYPPNEGTPELLAAISAWIRMRHHVDLAPSQITTLNGTREGLFNAALALCPETKHGGRPTILIPNPFYQVYAVAAGLRHRRCRQRPSARFRRPAARNPARHRHRLSVQPGQSARQRGLGNLSGRAGHIGRGA